MPSWDDLRLALALARGGGLASAATDLGVNPSTVFRRLNSLEAELGVRLFDRQPGGWQATTAGQRLLDGAERMEAEAIALDRELTGRDERLSGSLRLTSSETLAFSILPAVLAEFRTAHPGIRVELLIDNRTLSLSRREADVALRPVRPREGDLFGRKLAEVAWTVYGSSAYLDRHGSPAALADLPGHELIGWDEAATQVRAAAWLAERVPAEAMALRTSSLLAQLQAAKAGLGLAVLPCYLGDSESQLVRLFEPIADLARELWIVTHADLKGTARVRAFLGMAGEAIGRRHALIEGRQPQASAGGMTHCMA
jgi:DNA-binding transcriptional LysR family regulator